MLPQISIVIVSYNVEHFLQVCLYAVRQATRHIQAEVFVVDNQSSDGSCDMVRRLFPEVLLIENQSNPGFGVANNQAIQRSKGEYVLILNPDTILSESSLLECISFMESHPKAGALGVHMTDGWGNYLRESKRSLPTPWVSFYKIFGFAALFPKSRWFGKYHLGYLSKEGTHEVDILSGAFMFMRKSLLDKIGLFDEQFFMYGEDIDLSYRVLLSGYRNYYLGKTRIIHFKGESTKKGSLNYVLVFYKAMEIFAQKHFTGRGASPMRCIIEGAIWLRALLAIAKRVIDRCVFPIRNLLKSWFPQRVPIPKPIVVIGSEDDFCRVKNMLAIGNSHKVIHLSADIVTTNTLKQLITSHGADSVIFCMGSLLNADIIDATTHLRQLNIKMRILPPNGDVAVGSRCSN
jgi:O-antigen biosynthesis protein